MILRNIEQYLVQDDENQTAYLNCRQRRLLVVLVRQRVRGPRLLPEAARRTDPGREGAAAGQVPAQQPQARHLLELARATRRVRRGVGRLPPRQRRGQAGHDGRGLARRQEAEGGADHPREPVQFDNKFVLGRRRRPTASTRSRAASRKGKGPVYFNAYLTNFTLEDHHQGRAGDQGRAQVLQAEEVDKTDQGRRRARPGGRPEGREVRARAAREPRATLKSGDLVEIELEIESKNDYEYLGLRGHEGRRLRAGRGPQRLHGQRLGAYMSSSATSAWRSSSAARPRQAQRQLPPARRDPRQEPLCQMILQPRKGRQHVARGASPWNAGRHYLDPSPEGAKVGRQPRASVAPSGLAAQFLGRIPGARAPGYMPPPRSGLNEE
jgi:alpha-2-macroglobulin